MLDLIYRVTLVFIFGFNKATHNQLLAIQDIPKGMAVCSIGQDCNIIWLCNFKVSGIWKRKASYTQINF